MCPSSLNVVPLRNADSLLLEDNAIYFYLKSLRELFYLCALNYLLKYKLILFLLYYFQQTKH